MGDAGLTDLHEMQAVLPWDFGGGMLDLNQGRQFLGGDMLI